CRLTKP
ncbi:putative protease DegS, partial [Vibrio parahaemolyticus V-223/04]